MGEWARPCITMQHTKIMKTFTLGDESYIRLPPRTEGIAGENGYRISGHKATTPVNMV